MLGKVNKAKAAFTPVPGWVRKVSQNIVRWRDLTAGYWRVSSITRGINLLPAKRKNISRTTAWHSTSDL
jgi:hypothetical protein